MIVENNWLTTNIKEKAINNDLDLIATFNPYSYTKTSFDMACKNVCDKIVALDKPIYVGFSGGIDSEFVVRTFIKHNIPFTAVSVNTGTNRYEWLYIQKLFREYPNLTKILLDVSEPKAFFQKLINICKAFNTPALGSIGSIEAAQYVKSQNGIFVIAEHFISTKYDNSGIIMVETSEWDHYYDVLVDDNLVIPFFMYDLPIVESYVSQFNNEKIGFFKSDLYSLPFRPKFYHNFENKNMLNVYNAIVSKLRPTGNKSFVMTKEEFLGII